MNNFRKKGDPWVMIACGIFVIIYLYTVCNFNLEIYLLN